MQKLKKKTNRIIVIGVILLIACAVFSLFNVLKNTDKDDITKSPLATNEILYSDIKNAMKEINADTFLVVSYTEDLSIHKSEKEISAYLKKVNLLDNVMYLDAKNYLSEENFYDKLNKNLNLKKDSKIKKIPAVVFYKDGKQILVKDSSDKLLDKEDFKNYIESNELAS